MTTGGTEILIVLAIAVMLFGPKKLPELARTIGEAMGEYHKATREFETEIRKTSNAVDREITTATNVEPKSPMAKPPAPTPGISSNRPITQNKSATGSASKTPKNLQVKEIAKNLGINTTNKTDTQLLKEISLKTKKEKVSEG
jgi:TatA/E family protein of Tat protein translocase